MEFLKTELESKNFIYSGGHKKFSHLDAPGLILTQLTKENFSHLETKGRTTDLVIIKDGKRQRIRFSNECFYKFMVVLKDESILDVSELEEHITLDE